MRGVDGLAGPRSWHSLTGRVVAFACWRASGFGPLPLPLSGPQPDSAHFRGTRSHPRGVRYWYR
ncbi:hypothetical protein OID55_36610 [Streptomyces sp. NBC_00715]|uniref:hypothetical protein n=1 Tax=Streptomyces sp. NBC_00715 TaxID=2975811 RepID=UPI00386FEEC2